MKLNSCGAISRRWATRTRYSGPIEIGGPEIQEIHKPWEVWREIDAHIPPSFSSGVKGCNG